jgi:thioredoxin-related protein
MLNQLNMNKFLITGIALVVLAVVYAFKPSADATSNSGQINWLNLEQAEKAAKESGKLIFIDVYTEWCGPCKMLDRNTFSDPGVIEFMNKHFVAVKFNAEGADAVTFNGKKYSNPNFTPGKTGRNSQHEFASSLKVPGYPTMYLLDGKGAVVHNVVGYRTPDQLIEELSKTIK